MSTVKIRKRRAFAVIPDDILEDCKMRPETRLVLGWLIGRPDGWEVRVSYLQRVLGLTKPRWAKARKEMEAHGYLKQSRRKAANGKFVWEHVVTDMPTMVRKSTDGKSIDGKPGDITTPPDQQDFNTLPPSPLPGGVAITQACHDEATERFRGYSIEVLEGEWQKAVQRRGEIPRNPDKAFLAWAAIYVNNHPLPFGGGY